MSTVINIPPAVGQNIQANEMKADTESAPVAPPRPSGERSSGYGYGSRSSSQSRSAQAPLSTEQKSPFLPLLLGSFALLGWLGFQTYQLISERQALQVGYASQQRTVENASKLRTSLDALAADTQRLADGGNPNAKLLVDELRKRGITINTAAPGSNAVTPPSR